MYTHLSSVKIVDPGAVVLNWIESAMFADACSIAFTRIGMVTEKQVQLS